MTGRGRSDVDVVVVAVRPDGIARGIGQHGVTEGVLGVEVRRFGRLCIRPRCVHTDESTTRR
ncbi:hypothetical protein Cus16_1283 [Curtobacterium sp. ER1/6]|nr:hypothetical protein Cus16_1283 [Curtobacterium sp. ER1/6]